MHKKLITFAIVLVTCQIGLCQTVTCSAISQYSNDDPPAGHGPGLQYHLDLPKTATLVSAGAYVSFDNKQWVECGFSTNSCNAPPGVILGDKVPIQVGLLQGPSAMVDGSHHYFVNITDNPNRVGHIMRARLQLTYTMPGPSCVAQQTFRVIARHVTMTNLLVPKGSAAVNLRTFGREQDNTSAFAVCDDHVGHILDRCLPLNGGAAGGRLGFTLVPRQDLIDSAQGTNNQCGNDVDRERECRVEIDYVPPSNVKLSDTQAAERLAQWLPKKKTLRILPKVKPVAPVW